MKSRLEFDPPTASRFPTDRSFIYIRTTPNTAQRFICTRVGVVNPPPSPLALAFEAAMLKARHRLAAILYCQLIGGDQ